MYKYFFFSHKSHLTISNHPQSWDINRDLKNYPSCTGGPEGPIVPVAHVLPTNFINSVHQLGREDHHEDVLQDLLHQQIPPRKKLSAPNLALTDPKSWEMIQKWWIWGWIGGGFVPCQIPRGYHVCIMSVLESNASLLRNSNHGPATTSAEHSIFFTSLAFV